ncbi:hypothetical protein MMC20_001356 [Loxospora ochrophaea]|nr:hypothetical protein [Loxospora ochrophaea]
MASEEDNFDIDIYGDGGEDYHQGGQDDSEVKAETSTDTVVNMSEPAQQSTEALDGRSPATLNGQDSYQEAKAEESSENKGDIAQKIASTDESTHDPLQLPKQAPQTQGLKRKDGPDDRFIDPGATTALFISELHWWITDDDVRGWANQSQCEDELEDITFSEHKVNGKSKGQAYVLFKSPQAATAAKHKVESFGEGQQYTKKFTVSYTNPYTNPFRTLPKDGPMRNNNQNNRSLSGGYSNQGSMGGASHQQNSYNSGAGYRGNRGGYNNRGGMSNVGGYNRGGFQQPMGGGFQGNPMGGFPGAQMGGMQPYGGFQNRGGMMGGNMRGGSMGMRGGRGGMSPNGMMGMPMGGMGMGAMPGQMGGMNMGMPQMGAGIGMPGQASFQNPQAHYNPAFFAQQQGAQGGVGESTWNPHGAKRTRQE